MRILNMEQSISHLNEGKPLIYPTETFFALGCKVTAEKAISEIFQLKKRIFAMPLPVIIHDISQLSFITQQNKLIEKDLETLQEYFWPGPLSILLPAKNYLSPLLTGGTGKVAVRMSSHPVAQQLAKLCGEPIISSSANISGEPPSTCLENIDTKLLDMVAVYAMYAMYAMYNDEPKPSGGLPSTIIEPLGNKELLLYRVGATNKEQLQSKGFTVKEK